MIPNIGSIYVRRQTKPKTGGGTHFVLLQQIVPFLDDLGQRQRHVELAFDHTASGGPPEIAETK